MSEEVSKSEQAHTVKFDDALQAQNIRIHSLQCATALLRTEGTTKEFIEMHVITLAKRFEYYVQMGE